jgi:enolase
MLIKEISAKKIFDSRKEETIEVSINGQIASSPSGKSTGKYETKPYRKSLNQSINDIKSLKIEFQINSFADLHLVEDYIKQKFKLKDPKQFGANALFALESAILKALAKEKKKELWQIINPNARKFPVPVGNAIGGGLHSHNKNAPEFQEFLIIPKGKNIKENVSILQEVHKKLKNTLKSNKINDEGAWQTHLSNEQILSILSKVKNIHLGIDVAASTFFTDNSYIYYGKQLDQETQIKYINELIESYKLFYLEDPLNEEDFQGFSKIKKTKCFIVGDDLTATQISRLLKAIKSRSINAIIIKPNQNGSLLELHKIFHICKINKIKTIISHRSGETLDNSLADYADRFELIGLIWLLDIL